MNADGVYSLEKMKLAFPETSDEPFICIDGTGDGLVDVAELEIAAENGLCL